MAHALMIGDAGLWAGVSKVLTTHHNHVTLVAGNDREMEEATALARGSNGRIQMVRADVRQPGSTVDVVSEAAGRFGPVTLVLNRLGEEAFATTQALAEWLEKSSPVCRFFQILETLGRVPAEVDAAVRAYFHTLTRVLYRCVWFSQNDRSKLTLTDEVLCNGVVEAIREDRMDLLITQEGVSRTKKQRRDT